MKEKLERMRKKEIEYLYNSIDKKISEKELEEIDNIMINNIEIFEKMSEIVKETLNDIENSKKNKELKLIIDYYNNVLEEDFFFILLTKIIILSQNDLDKNRFNSEENEENFLKSRWDVINFTKDKIFYLYLYILSSKKNKEIVGSQKQIIDNIEFSILKIIENLCNKKIFIQRNIIIDNKTKIFLEIPKLKNNFRINIYFEKFRILNNLENLNLKSNYIINSTIFSIYEINKVSGKTGSQFIIGENSYIEEINKLKININLKELEKKFNNFCEKEKININKIEDFYKKYKEDLKKFIYEKNKIAIKEISQKVSIYHKALIFLNIIKIIKEKKICSFYLPFLMDFRGRIYKLSSISPTFFKEIRRSIFFEKEEKNKKIEKEIIEIENKIEKIISKYLYKLDELNIYKKENNLNKKEKISIFWVLISIAQIFKKELENKISIENFIDKSNYVLNNLELIKDKEKLEEVLYYKEIIDEIINNKKSFKLISKDATASVYQHLIKILGAKKDEWYDYTNLSDPENWYDTYSKIIEKWKEEEKEIYKEKKEIINKFFIRENLKKTMMTENYGCGKKKCWNYFKLISKCEENIEIKKLFINFYNYITKNGIFKNKSEEIIQKMLEKKGLILNQLDSSKSDLMYKKKKEKRINTTFKKKRYTLKKMEFIDFENEDNFLINEFKISIRANTIHFTDSAAAREIIKRIRCIAIHDCFMVEAHKITRLIAIANFVMNMDFIKLDIDDSNKKFFSLFILL